jgi:hypothetical protein
MLRGRMSERRWFVLGDDGRPAGPLTTTEIIRALLDERVASDAKLCAEGTTEWREAQAIEEFRIAAKAVRATVKRRLSGPPLSDDVRVPDDEEDVATRYFTPGARAARMASWSAARADTDDDDDEVKTAYFQQPSASSSQAESVPRAAPPVPPPPRPVRPPAPVATAPPPGVRLASSARSVASSADDDEDEVETRYFQPGAAPPTQRSPCDDDEDEVKTGYFQQPSRAPAVQPSPPAPARNTAMQPYLAPRVASVVQPPMPQPASLAAPLPAILQQPSPPAASGPSAMTVTVAPVRSRSSSWALVIAGFTAFLVALLAASGVAWLMLRQ